VVGLQDPGLDALLEAARAPGDEAARTAAFRALQARLATGTYLLPLAWPNVVTVVSDRVIGPAPRPVADGSERFGDVLTWRLANGR
jgi:ABC-type transport system substrate-binding protein